MAAGKYKSSFTLDTCDLWGLYDFSKSLMTFIVVVDFTKAMLMLNKPSRTLIQLQNHVSWWSRYIYLITNTSAIVMSVGRYLLEYLTDSS